MSNPKIGTCEIEAWLAKQLKLREEYEKARGVKRAGTSATPEQRRTAAARVAASCASSIKSNAVLTAPQSVELLAALEGVGGDPTISGRIARLLQLAPAGETRAAAKAATERVRSDYVRLKWRLRDILR